jgi:hypothetical protein
VRVLMLLFRSFLINPSPPSWKPSLLLGGILHVPPAGALPVCANRAVLAISKGLRRVDTA